MLGLLKAILNFTFKIYSGNSTEIGNTLSRRYFQQNVTCVKSISMKSWPKALSQGTQNLPPIQTTRDLQYN